MRGRRAASGARGGVQCVCSGSSSGLAAQQASRASRTGAGGGYGVYDDVSTATASYTIGYQRPRVRREETRQVLGIALQERERDVIGHIYTPSEGVKRDADRTPTGRDTWSCVTGPFYYDYTPRLQLTARRLCILDL